MFGLVEGSGAHGEIRFLAKGLGDDLMHPFGIDLTHRFIGLLVAELMPDGHFDRLAHFILIARVGSIPW